MVDEYKPSTLLIKAIGNWNPRIFSPNWIANNLLDKKKGEKVSIELLFNLGEQDYGYEVHGIKIFPTLNNLSLLINTSGDIIEKNILLVTHIISQILKFDLPLFSWTHS